MLPTEPSILQQPGCLLIRGQWSLPHSARLYLEFEHLEKGRGKIQTVNRHIDRLPSQLLLGHVTRASSPLYYRCRVRFRQQISEIIFVFLLKRCLPRRNLVQNPRSRNQMSKMLCASNSESHATTSKRSNRWSATMTRTFI